MGFADKIKQMFNPEPILTEEEVSANAQKERALNDIRRTASWLERAEAELSKTREALRNTSDLKEINRLKRIELQNKEEVMRWRYKIDDLNGEIMYDIRPNTTEDIAERQWVLENFAEEFSNIPHIELVKSAYHATARSNAHGIILDGLKSSDQRYDGYIRSSDSNGMNSATSVETIKWSINDYLMLGTYKQDMAGGVLFEISEDNIIQVNDLSLYVKSIDFKEHPDSLKSVITTSENVPLVKQWMQEVGLNDSIVYTFREYLDVVRVRAEELHKEMEKDTKEQAKAQESKRGEKMEKQRFFVDMDGTLAEFKNVDTLEKLYEEGYFLNLAPHENVVDAVKKIIAENEDVEVFIMSAVLSDSKYALAEKNAWIDKYLPQIDEAHRIFPPCGEDKKEYIPDGVRENDFLLDDYTHNLTLWQPPARGIKLLNGINHTNGTWQHDRLDYNKSAEVLAENIVSIMHGREEIKDDLPVKEEENKSMINATSEVVEAFLKEQPTVAGQRFGIFQLSEGIDELDETRFLENNLNGDNFELIHFNNRFVWRKDQYETLEELFVRFNTGMQPSNYYGTSVSVGDVIVLSQDGKDFEAYRCGSFGFTRDDSFITDKVVNRMERGIDIRKERDLLDEYVMDGIEGIPTLSRDMYISDEYKKIFELADTRKRIEEINDAKNRLSEQDLQSIEDLASKMDEYIFDYDGYGYFDTVGEGNEFETREDFIQSMVDDIVIGNIDPYVDQFKEMQDGVEEKQFLQYGEVLDGLYSHERKLLTSKIGNVEQDLLDDGILDDLIFNEEKSAVLRGVLNKTTFLCLDKLNERFDENNLILLGEDYIRWDNDKEKYCLYLDSDAEQMVDYELFFEPEDIKEIYVGDTLIKSYYTEEELQKIEENKIPIGIEILMGNEPEYRLVIATDKGYVNAFNKDVYKYEEDAISQIDTNNYRLVEYDEVVALANAKREEIRAEYNRVLDYYEEKGISFPYREEYYDKYLGNLCNAIKKWSNDVFLNLTDEEVVYLAKLEARYVDLSKLDVFDYDFDKERFFEAVKSEVGVIDFKDLESMDYIVLDTETTGFKKDDEIIELGITDKNGNVLYEGMFKPFKELSEEASAVNGITMADLEDKPSFDSEFEKIVEIIGDKTLVIYNKGFDTRMMLQTAKIHYRDEENYQNAIQSLEKHFEEKTFCGMQSYAEYKQFYKSTKLVEALKEQGVEKVQSHRAVDDCLDTINLIKAVVEKEIKAEQIYQEIIERSVENYISEMEMQRSREIEYSLSLADDRVLTDGEAERMWEHERDRGHTWDIGEEQETGFKKDDLFKKEYENNKDLLSAIKFALNNNIDDADIKAVFSVNPDGEIETSAEYAMQMFKNGIDGVLIDEDRKYAYISLLEQMGYDIENAPNSNGIDGYDFFLYKGEQYLSINSVNGFSDVCWFDTENRQLVSIEQGFDLTYADNVKSIKEFETSGVSFEKKIEKEVEIETNNLVIVQSASKSNYEGYVVLSQFDRDGTGDVQDKVYLGKESNYDNYGNYDNSDNSLVFVSNNPRMFHFLSGSGWVVSQQEMIDDGTFTKEDYAEFAHLKETVLKQFKETREVKFEIDMEKWERGEDSGVPFTYPNWQREQIGEKGINKTDKTYVLGNYEYDKEDGYLHFTVDVDGYQLEGLYRVNDTDYSAEDNHKLISIDYGYLHPIIDEKWSEIESVLTEYVEKNITHREEIMEERKEFTLEDFELGEILSNNSYPTGREVMVACKINGEDNVLHCNEFRDGERVMFTINSEINDVGLNSREHGDLTNKLVEKIYNLVEQKEIIVKTQMAEESNYEDYLLLIQHDREGSGAEYKAFLGKKENYDGKGNYNNTDNSLVFITNNKNMEFFLNAGAGSPFSQQRVIESGRFTEADYAEFNYLKETVLKQFKEIREKKFQINRSKFESGIETGVPFSYPEWDKGFVRCFYVGEKEKEVEQLQAETGWKKIMVSEFAGMNNPIWTENGEIKTQSRACWVVYRDISDLPEYLHEKARMEEEISNLDIKIFNYRINNEKNLSFTVFVDDELLNGIYRINNENQPTVNNNKLINLQCPYDKSARLQAIIRIKKDEVEKVVAEFVENNKHRLAEMEAGEVVMVESENMKDEESKITPIQEFHFPDGKIAQGHEIPAIPLVEQGIEMGYADRTAVYNAVREFEQNNHIKNPVIDENGRYEDKEFLYGAYDDYVAMSHKEELVQYENRFPYLGEHETNLPYLAQIYYAKVNNLSDEDIDFMIETVNKKPYSSEKMADVRKMLESGREKAEITLLASKDVSTLDAINHNLDRAKTDEQKEILYMSNDLSTAWVIGSMFGTAERNGNGTMYDTQAKALAEATAMLHEYNDTLYKNESLSNEERYGLRVDVGVFAEQIGSAVEDTDINITADEIKAVASGYIKNKIKTGMPTWKEFEEILNETRNNNMEQPQMQQESVHSNENNEERKEEMAQKKSENLLAGEEKLSAKDQVMRQLMDGIKETMDSEQFANWCRTQGRLFYNNYSLRNALLTYFQKPDATYVCGYEKWKDYGRQVKQGAKGIKVLAPIFAKELNGKGSLYSSIRKQCNEQLKKDSEKEYATFHLGQSALSFRMYRNGLFDVLINDKTKYSSLGEDALRKFLDKSVIGKVPTYYNAVTVFDVSDTTDDIEFLWVAKETAKKSEMVLDNEGKPIVSKNGQVKIYNSAERKEKFNVGIEMNLPEQDPKKMELLYDTLKTISEKKGIPMSEATTLEESSLESALGFYRHATEEYPNGNIVIKSDLSLTDKVAVAFHEIAHSDLHKDVEWLKNEMDLDAGEKISRSMKEVQAEAVAFMTASTFGIETEHKSFGYIAEWSNGRDLKELEKSLDVIYKESQSLLREIEAELDNRGYTMEFKSKAKALTKEERTPIIEEVKGFVLNNTRANETLQKSIMDELGGNAIEAEEEKTIVKEQAFLSKEISDKLSELDGLIEKYAVEEDRGEQINLEELMEASMKQIKTAQEKINALSEERVDFIHEQSKDKSNLKSMFYTDSLKALKQLRKEVPQMKDLSDADLKLLAKSGYVEDEYAQYIGVDNERFAEYSMKQLDNIKSAMSKNNCVVEITWCEQWRDDLKIFDAGTVAHPKEANKIIADAEKQIRALKTEAEKKDDYFPYHKCNLTVISVDEKGKVSAFKERVDIGDGYQKDLKDVLEQTCPKSTLCKQFVSSTRERSNVKILLPEWEKTTVSKQEERSGQTLEEFEADISRGKDNTSSFNVKEKEKGNEKIEEVEEERK